MVIAPYGKQNKEGSDQADDHILHRVVDAGGQYMLWVGMKDKVHRIFPYFPQHPDGAGKRNSEITGKNTVSRDDATVLFHEVIKNDAQKAEYYAGKGMHHFIVKGEAAVSAKGNSNHKSQKTEQIDRQRNQIRRFEPGDLPK